MMWVTNQVRRERQKPRVRHGLAYQTLRGGNKFLWVWHLKRGESPRAAR